MLLTLLVSYNDDVDGDVALFLMAILGGLLFLGAIFDAVGEGGCLFILLMIFFIYLAYSDSEKKAEEAEAKEATRKANLAYHKAARDRAAKAKRAKKKRTEETKKWNLYTPQKYYDKIVDKIDSSKSKEVIDALDKLKDSSFNDNYFDKYPLYYLENKSNELKIKVPKRSKKKQTKKEKIIEALIKAKWRIETKKEKQVILNDWESMTINELKIKLKEKGLPVGGRKAELVDRCRVQISEVKVNLVTGLDDFKLDRMDLIIKKLRHKNRLVRKAAAFALPDDVVLRNLEDRQLYRNALQESLSNVVRDLRNDQPYVFESSYINPNRNINWKTEEIRERLDKLDEGDWESKMKIMDSAKVVANKEPFTGLETNEDLGERVPLSFKEWSKDNKGKTFSDYKSEVLGK